MKKRKKKCKRRVNISFEIFVIQIYKYLKLLHLKLDQVFFSIKFFITNCIWEKLYYIYIYVYIYDRLKRYYSNYSKIHLYANRRIIWWYEGAINYGQFTLVCLTRDASLRCVFISRTSLWNNIAQRKVLTHLKKFRKVLRSNFHSRRMNLARVNGRSNEEHFSSLARAAR